MAGNINLLRTYRPGVGHSVRTIGVFLCPECLCEFESRADRLDSMTGLCRACSNKKAGLKRKTHGFNNRNSRLHCTWSNMKRRCLSPVGKELTIYKGVTLCEEWMQFEPFMHWSLENGYTDKLTIDRIDSSLGYSPDNCRYVGYSVQAANRKKTDQNKSGHVGVSWDRGRWVAKVQWQRKQIHLGRFERIEDAIEARNRYINDNDLPHLEA